ncbi:syncytin-B-like [Manis pentadactyla]|uniref:syncytin-B-like n=1 Tax=Manis pentadactyla TaxID=143292 RepID=UPI00255D14E9|nr:syncytin-B-like [Manis pentadactyla]
MGELLLDPETQSIIQAAFTLLNTTNPDLSKACWLCLKPGPLQVNALLVNLSLTEPQCLLLPSSSGVYLDPFSPKGPCFKADPHSDNTSGIDVGRIHYSFCQQNITVNNTLLCPPNGTVFICGGDVFGFLPTGWMGLCAPAVIFPDIGVVPTNQSLPIPALDHIGGRSKRAIQVISLLLGLGVATGAATGAARLGTSLHYYKALSQQMNDDLRAVASTILDLQAQLDSLTAVVLQNHRGLDLLTAEKGGLCLFLQKECCFYVNRSGIIQNKVKQLQEDLERHRHELQANFLWTGLRGWLPYILPLLGPILLLLLLFTFGSCIINKIVQFVQKRIESIQLMNVQVQYQRLATEASDPCSLCEPYDEAVSVDSP